MFRSDFLHQGVKLVEKHVSGKLSINLGPEFLDGRCDNLILGLLEKFAQSPGPIKQLGVDLNVLGLVSRDDVVLGPDVTSGVELDCLTWTAEIVFALEQM